jgi:hypothetical protein
MRARRHGWLAAVGVTTPRVFPLILVALLGMASPSRAQLEPEAYTNLRLALGEPNPASAVIALKSCKKDSDRQKLADIWWNSWAGEHRVFDAFDGCFVAGDRAKEWAKTFIKARLPALPEKEIEKSASVLLDRLRAMPTADRQLLQEFGRLAKSRINRGGAIFLPKKASSGEKPKAPALPDVPEGYEIIESLLLPGKAIDKQQDLDKQLEAALGKEPAKKVERDGPYLGNIKWEPKKIKPGDKIRVYFPTISSVSTDTIYVRVNGKVVWKRERRNQNLSEEIELPASADDKKVALLRIHVDWIRASIYAGVDNIYILRPKAKTK